MFDGLVGNVHVKERLRRMINAGRLAHSLLFAGPEGVGKKQFALEIARSLVCPCKSGDSGCGECAACRRAVAFSFPNPTPDKKDEFKNVFFSEHSDVGMVVSYNRYILVDAIRDLEAEANFMPYEAAARVFIIDDADRMNIQAANALLKTLEEPPATSYIILVTSRPDRLPSTILSRCQVVRFAGVPAGELENYLVDAKGSSPDDAAIAARVCKGSIGRAIDMDVDAFKASRELMLEVVESAIKHRDLGVMLQIAEQINDTRNKGRFESSLEMLETLVRDILVIRVGGERVVNSDISKRLAKFAEAAPAAALSGWLAKIEQINADLKVNINRRIAADALFVQMAA